MKGAGVNEPEDLPQEEEELGAGLWASEPLGDVVCSVCAASLEPDMPRPGMNCLTAKNTPATINRVMSNREKVVSRAIVCECY